MGPSYWDISKKIEFMDKHDIAASVISLANPWLDFLDPAEAAPKAKEINDDLEAQCSRYPRRLFFFGALPLSAGVETIVHEIKRLQELPHCRGIILGTSGAGNGLDDPELNPIWSALESSQTMVFLHPHYGLPKSVYGPRGSEYGHVLPLALGFPLETTIAVSTMYLSGLWDRFPKLEFLLAHSGGTIPFLAARIESCIAHDSHLKHDGTAPRRNLWDVLKTNIYLDAVIYGEVGLGAAVQAVGVERVLFGTDHPFFPPLEGEEQEWQSVRTNYDAIKAAFSNDKTAGEQVLGANAIRILKLDI